MRMNAGRRTRPVAVYYAGMAIVVAMVLGGGTGQGLWTDHLLQLALLPALFVGLGRFNESRFDILAKSIVVLAFALLALQFVPIYRQQAAGFMIAEPQGWGMYSPAANRSLQSALFMATATGFSLFISRLSDKDQQRCLRFVFTGFFVNSVALVVQLSFDRRLTISGVFPFEITAGLFANENHLSALIYVMIPLLAYQLLIVNRRPVFYGIAVLVLVFLLFAVGSHAGMAISLVLALVSFFWFVNFLARPVSKFLFLFSALALVISIVFFAGLDSKLEGDLRMVFYSTTWKAIRDHWLGGSGLGTFVLTYPAYEAREDIVNVYANHAHSEYLEIFLETGISGVLLISAYFVAMVRGSKRSRFAEAAFLSVMALLLHSLVDYPLRTTALAILFAYLSAIILSHRPDNTGAGKLRTNEPSGTCRDIKAETSPTVTGIATHGRSQISIAAARHLQHGMPPPAY